MENERVRQAVKAAKTNERNTVVLFYPRTNLSNDLKVILDRHQWGEVVIENIAEVEAAQMSGDWECSTVMVRVQLLSNATDTNWELFADDISPELIGIATVF